MTTDVYWVVVTRSDCIPIERYQSLDDAGDRITRDRAYGIWTVLKQGRWASSQFQALTLDERKRLERRLYPALFDGG